MSRSSNCRTSEENQLLFTTCTLLLDEDSGLIIKRTASAIEAIAPIQMIVVRQGFLVIAIPPIGGN